jgi:predicted O-methyltransferase YrrM
MTEFWKTIPHSMFDFVSFYNDVAAALPPNCRIAEVGVADGASALFLAERMSMLGKPFHMRMIDNLDYGRAKQFKTIMDNVYASGMWRYIDVLPVDSLNASLEFPDQYFDFVFIDSGHTYELTKAEIRLWWHKVKDGGILAGHDYHGEIGVQMAADEIINKGDQVIVDTSQGYGVWSVRKSPLIMLR